MDKKERLNLITRNAIEILNETEIKKHLSQKTPKVYCGYEPSGPIHLGHLVTIIKLLDFQKANVKPIVLLADWHAWLNKKGDWSFLKKQMISWEKGIKAVGLTKAKFIRGTSFQQKKEYFEDLLTLSLQTTVTRGIRSMQTIARDIEHAKISQIIYPLMQVADIKALNVDFVAAGMDQRKIHVLGIETFPKIKFSKKPSIIHTGIITSLKGPGNKMSSSIPESMISIKDSKTDIEKKINRAHCPARQTEQNPVLEITRYLLFPKFGKIIIKRDKKYGDNKTYNAYPELENDFTSNILHPQDLKNATSEYLERLLAPIRKAFKN